MVINVLVENSENFIKLKFHIKKNFIPRSMRRDSVTPNCELNKSLKCCLSTLSIPVGEIVGFKLLKFRTKMSNSALLTMTVNDLYKIMYSLLFLHSLLTP